MNVFKVLSSATLSEPFFHENYPNYINYGLIGFLAGHEITHRYDETADYDKHYPYVWTKEDLESFNKVSQCLIDQYNALYDVETKTKVDGTATLKENFADAGGLATAYKAYMDWLKTYGDEPQLPGLNYTSEQMFFMSFGRFQCKRYNESFPQPQDAIQMHAPGRFRANVPLMNFDKFSEAFNCPVGSPMNPVKKCKII